MSKLVEDFSKFESQTPKQLEEYGVKNNVSFVVRAGKIVQIIEDPKMKQFCEAAQADFEARKLATAKMRENINHKIDALNASSVAAPTKTRK